MQIFVLASMLKYSSGYYFQGKQINCAKQSSVLSAYFVIFSCFIFTMSFVKSLNNILPSNFEMSPDPAVCLHTCLERYLNGLEFVDAELTAALNERELFDAYVTCLLHLLGQELHKQQATSENQAGDKNLPSLSVYQMQQLTKLMEFVVCLGIYPLLSVGVSAPLDVRMDHADKYACPQLHEAPDRHARLYQVGIFLHRFT